MYQFGFKKGLSTELCTSVVKRTTTWIVVATYSLVLLIFKKPLIVSTLGSCLLKCWTMVAMLVLWILPYWYSHQTLCVYWQGLFSDKFSIGNGTRQGGVLSPYLFTRYVRPLISSLSSSRLGCNIGGLFVNTLAYADDMVLLAPSWYALQSLIKILERWCTELDIVCNKCKKTVVYTLVNGEWHI